ncbi:response regulator transcription factor [Leucobacter chromiireducens]|uniref:DNA-binding response regulator n=1 Tax=Leucobacter chromiireducens subsp. solipictus TaxID=398235 RepID=A0ABS1SEW9_9MICO|nr:response regulator transcription factor [Leucobacter chromiireducens]MBL3679091.1 DNA-binding response regulator [Leucobacter chromiireducens subsp. solipictus]
MRVLVVEDHPVLGPAVRTHLAREGFAVDLVADGDAALESLAVHGVDLLVLDRDIPGVHGDEVARRAHQDHPEVRVLMLTAAATLQDKVDGFELGVDDYLTKPFALAELVMRLRALGRRPTTALPTTLRWGSITLDPFKREVQRAGAPVTLTRKQFGVLEHLMRADGGLVSAETLLEKVWDEHADPFTTAPRVTVSTLRRALGAPDPIETVVGEGYRMAADA